MTISLSTLFSTSTAAELLSTGLELAASLGLPTTSWRKGDPERTLFRFLANALAERDSVASEFIRAGFLTTSRGSWKTLVASEMYGVEREGATYATPSVTFSNSGGASYSKAAGEVIVKASSTGVLFRNSAALSLASGPGTTAIVAFVADDAGSDGTVGVDDVDTIVSTMLGVSITSSTAATGIDEQSDEALEDECLTTLGALSANGPPDAYNAVCLDSGLTGRTEITRAATVENASDGTVTVYIAGASGAVAAGVVSDAQDAVETWATPACVTPTVVSAAESAQTIAYNVDGDDIPASADSDIESLVTSYLAGLAIGGYLATSALISLAHEYLVDAGASNVDVELTSPAASVDLSPGQIATVGSVTVTEV